MRSLNIDINQGNVQPMPIALPDFLSGAANEGDIGRNVTGVISNNLQRSGLFAPINPAAFIEKITNTDSVPRFPIGDRSMRRPWSPAASRARATAG